MHDSLGYISRDPIYRSWHHNEMTFSLMYAFSEQFVLPISHDEVVHGKGSLWSRSPVTNGRRRPPADLPGPHVGAPGQAVAVHGQELGNPGVEPGDPAALAAHGLPAARRCARLVGDLNRIYKSSPALYSQDFTPAGFTWLDANDREGNVLAYLRADGRFGGRLRAELLRGRTAGTASGCRSPGSGGRR